MKFDQLLQTLTEKHKGVHRKIIPELTAAIWDDNGLMKEVVDRFVKSAVAGVVYTEATSARRSGQDAARTGVKEYTPRHGDNRDSILRQQEDARQRWLSSLKNYALFGGLRLAQATVKDVEASIAAREKTLQRYVEGVERGIKFERMMVRLAKAAGTDKIVDILVLENEDILKDGYEGDVALAAD